MKKCNLCGESRIEMFYTYQKTRCKACQRAKQYEFNRNNPEYLKAKNQRRRARLKALPHDFPPNVWKAVLDRFDGRCCLTNSKDVSLEHVVPLCVGHMGTEIGNVIPLDRTLNLSKGSKNFLDWFNEIEASLEMHDRFDEVISYLAELNGLTFDQYLEFLYWCEDNKRTIEEIEAATMSSVELFKATIEN
ncbi:hypothetical protein [Mesobacillus maritimus]|uniref:HNH endonuclease n=1 Tax=Mesobacillus maritimus TaxID=1643336 RepID=A0ABS7K8T5_9BACI|nr:hypothetical protein [Mesobacillus maritimus]MBY0098679.1 hypothetical protein [Mesobacillus maritimus]